MLWTLLYVVWWWLVVDLAHLSAWGRQRGRHQRDCRRGRPLSRWDGPLYAVLHTAFLLLKDPEITWEKKGGSKQKALLHSVNKQAKKMKTKAKNKRQKLSLYLFLVISLNCLLLEVCISKISKIQGGSASYPLEDPGSLLVAGPSLSSISTPVCLCIHWLIAERPWGLIDYVSFFYFKKLTIQVNWPFLSVFPQILRDSSQGSMMIMGQPFMKKHRPYLFT